MTVSGKLVIKYITDLDCKQNFITGEFDTLQVKKDTLLIYEGVLSGAIKNKNKVLAKRAEEEYKPKNNNLFDEE